MSNLDNPKPLLNHKNSLLTNLLLPPAFRFIVEITTWVWLLFAGFWYLSLLSFFVLGIFNVKDDKNFEGILVPGYLRVFFEYFSAFLGILSAYLYFHLLLLAVLQSILVLITFILDKERLKWFLGVNKYPPLYVRPYYEKLLQKALTNKKMV